MTVLADEADEIDEGLGIVLEREVAVLELDVARVDPVGDKDRVVAQQGPNRAAQKGGEVAGHRGDEEHLRLVLSALPAETEQLAERRPQDAALFDGNRLAVN